MKEKLIDLRCQAHNLATDASAFDDATYAQQLEVEANHLIGNGVTFAEDNNVPSKWISVNDRLPEKDQIVLCYKAGRGVRIGKHLVATYADGVSAFKDCLLDYAFGATHWMPLPEPPKGE